LTSAFSEGRQNPLYPWSKVFDAVFLGSACQFGPLHRIETECRRGALHQRIGTLSEDMLGYAMQRQIPPGSSIWVARWPGNSREMASSNQTGRAGEWSPPSMGLKSAAPIAAAVTPA